MGFSALVRMLEGRQHGAVLALLWGSAFAEGMALSLLIFYEACGHKVLPLPVAGACVRDRSHVRVTLRYVGDKAILTELGQSRPGRPTGRNVRGFRQSALKAPRRWLTSS